MIPLAAAHVPAHVPANWPGWLVIIAVGVLFAGWLLKLPGGK